MLLNQHRVIVATFRRAPSDLFFSRAKLRSERYENSKESVGYRAVAENSANPPQTCTACRTAEACPWYLATADQGLCVPCTDTGLGARSET